MARKTLPLFSILLISIFIGCGGNIQQTPVQSQPAVVPISAADVFSNIAETWTFKDGFGNMLFIDVMPIDATHTVWHYHKNADQAYWAPGVASAELYFFLEKDSTGAWYSTGGHILMPQGCPWCTPTPTTPVDLTYSVASVPGHPRPYLILADSGTTDDTVFPDEGQSEARWTTKNYTECIQQECFLISEQWEGSAGHEKWWFKPGKGMWKIEPLNQGAGNVDTRLNLQRIN